MAAGEVQCTIDIATSMPAGESTLAQLDEITARLTGAGRGADHFQQAIVQASNALTAAKATTTDANTALADANAPDTASSRKAALQAAKAQEKAALKGAVPPEIARASSCRREAAVDAYAGEPSRSSRQRPEAHVAAEETHLAQTLANVKKDLGPRRQGTRGSSRDLGQTTRRTRRRGRAARFARQSLAGPGEGLPRTLEHDGHRERYRPRRWRRRRSAFAVTVVAAGVAFVAGTLAVAKWAIGLADSARSAGLDSRGAVEAMNPEIAALPRNGSIPAVSAATGIGTDRLGELAKS